MQHIFTEFFGNCSMASTMVLAYLVPDVATLLKSVPMMGSSRIPFSFENGEDHFGCKHCALPILLVSIAPDG